MKNRLVIILLLAALATEARAQKADEAVARYEEMYRQSGNASLLWLIAEEQARAGNKDAAIAALERVAALRLGLYPALDSPVVSLAGDPRYDALLARMRAALPLVVRGRQVATVAADGLVPEGMAVAPSHKLTFLGDMNNRAILAIPPSGRVRVFARNLDLRPLGMTVDAKRKLLWVATTNAFWDTPAPRSALLGFDLGSGRLVRTVTSADMKSMNDVALGPDGDLFVTDSLGGAVFRMRPGELALTRITPAGAMSYPNGLVATPDGKFLFVAQGIALVRVDLATGTLKPTPQPPNLVLMGTDGLYWHRDRLIAVQNGTATPPRVLLLHLSPALDSISGFEPLEAGNPLLDMPTTSAVDGDRFYLLANSQLTRLGNDGKISQGPPLKPITILELSVPEKQRAN